MSLDVSLTELTNATTADDGTGVFDVLMNAVNLHIEDQYNKTRITGTDYATVYLGALQSVIAQSVQFLVGEKTSIKERAIKDEQALNEADKRLSTAKARELQEAQRRLYERQIIGFDDNKEIKAFESQLNSWALLHSSGMIDAVEIPSVISATNLQSTYDSLVADTDESKL